LVVVRDNNQIVSLGVDRAARRKVQEPNLARKRRQLLREIETALLS
jgi:hypothetical protein